MAAKWSGSVGRLQQYTNLQCITLPHTHIYKSKLTEVVTINFMVLQFKLDIANINKRQKNDTVDTQSKEPLNRGQFMS